MRTAGTTTKERSYLSLKGVLQLVDTSWEREIRSFLYCLLSRFFSSFLSQRFTITTVHFMTEEEKTSVQCSKITKKVSFIFTGNISSKTCFSGKKSQSQISIQHFEFSRTFLALVGPLLLDCQYWKKCGKIQNVVLSSDFEIFFSWNACSSYFITYVSTFLWKTE